MGAIRPQTPNQELSSWTSSVGSLHTGHDGSASASPDPLLRSLDPISGHIAYWTRRNLGNYQQCNMMAGLFAATQRDNRMVSFAIFDALAVDGNGVMQILR